MFERASSALSVAACVLLANTAAAESTVTVVPLGHGEAFPAAVRTAAALVESLRRNNPERARLVYPAPDPPAATFDRAEATRLQQAARRSFKNLEFGAVRKDANNALQLYKRLVKGGGPVDGYLNMLHLLAAAALFDGDAKAAFRAMNDAVVFEQTPPSKKQFNPTVQHFFNEVLDKPLAKNRGRLQIEAPAGALVWFNRRLHGPAHDPITIRAGLYLVQVYLPGSPLWLRWVRIEPGKPTKISVSLTASGAPPALALALAGEIDRDKPGTAIRKVEQRHSTAEVILVAPEKDCSQARCTLRARWSAAGKWKSDRVALYVGDGEATATDLLGEGKSGQRLAGGIRACTLDSQCALKERCIDGRCRRPASIVRKWWFWTAVGVVAAAATVAIVIPLSRPDGPVIEVR